MPGIPVAITVSFHCDENDPLAEIAREYLPRFGGNYDAMPDGIREARYFLDDLSNRTGSNPGANGGLCTWGTIGNYTPPEFFVEALRPFFLRVWLKGVIPFEERVVILAQRQGGESQAFYVEVDPAVSVSKEGRANLLDVRVLTDVLPFGWFTR